LNEIICKWSLRKNFFKELDVILQRVIDNAVGTYDRLRLDMSERERENELKKSERGTGKCLSKLQAQIAVGPVVQAPKIKGPESGGFWRDTERG
jgi:RNA polymerase II elongation factor ELL